MDTISIIKNRRSIRAYLDKSIPRNILEDLVDCGRLAPSGMNGQPWQFIVITDKERLKYLSEQITYGKFIKNAAACIVVYCEKNSTHHLEDGAAATENIIIAAKAYGIGTCWVAGYNRIYEQVISEYLGIPDNLRMISIISLGYPAEEPPKNHRKPLSNVIHWERY